MADLELAIVLLLVLAIGGTAIALRVMAGAHRSHAKWELAEHVDKDCMLVGAERGDEFVVFGTLELNDKNFESEIEFMRAEARQTVVAMNNRW